MWQDEGEAMGEDFTPEPEGAINPGGDGSL